MKRLLTAILALIMVLITCACAKSDESGKTNDNPSKPQDGDSTINENPSEPEDDGMVTIYQRMSETMYFNDGSNGYFQNFYTYDDKGNLLARECDIGPDERWYDEETGIEKLIKKPFDGSVNSSTYFLYTQEGHFRYSDHFDGPVTENGKLIDELYIKTDCYYTYLEDGRIDTMEVYQTNFKEPAYDEPTTSYKFSYNENKQLISVICTTPYTEGTEAYRHLGTWSYDDQGRLIEERYYNRGTTDCYRYTYNDQGLLATAQYGRVNVDECGRLLGEKEICSDSLGSQTFTYDEAGRLIDPENDSIRYDSEGQLIFFYDYTITYHEDGSKEVSNGDSVYRFDEHGNLIWYTYSDDAYVQIEYKAFEVTKAEAERLERARMLRNDYSYNQMRKFEYEYMTMIDIPCHPLYEYELLLSGLIRY